MVTVVKVGNLITPITFKNLFLLTDITIKKAFYIMMITSVFIAEYLIQ